jgi:hypothetical protein
MTNRIEALARRVQRDPFFLASALVDYAQSEGLNDQDLANRLGCSLEILSPLGLCRRPRRKPELFRQDVNQITTRFGIKIEILAEAIRRSDTLSAMRKGEIDEEGILMAARDRQHSSPKSKDTKGKSS